MAFKRSGVRFSYAPLKSASHTREGPIAFPSWLHHGYILQVSAKRPGSALTACFPGHRIRTDYTDADADLEKDFYLLRHTSCPAVLTENHFIDNQADVEYLLSDIGQTNLVNLHVTASSSTSASTNEKCPARPSIPLLSSTCSRVRY